MADRYNVTLELQLRGPTNTSQVVGDLRRQLATAGAVNVDATRAISGLNATQAALKGVQAQAAAVSGSFRTVTSIATDGSRAMQDFGHQAFLAAKRFTAFTVAAGSLLTATRAIREGVRAAVEFDLAMNKVAQVSEEAGDRTGAVRNQITQLATQFGVSSSQLAQVAVTAKQAGLNLKETGDFLRTIALTDLAPNFDSMAQSAEGLIAVFRQFKLESGRFEEALGGINAVAGGFAVEASDIIQAVKAAGGAFASVSGQLKDPVASLNEFQALFTSVRSTTRESAEAIATGLRTVFTRFQRNDTVLALKDLGVNLRFTREEAQALGQTNLENQFVGAYEAVRRLSEGLAGLRETDPRFASVVEQLGGYRQISRVIPLLKQFEDAERARNIAVAGGISLQAAAEKRQETFANKLSKVKEEYLATTRSVFDSKGFQATADALFTLASGFTKIVEAATPLLPVLTAIAGVKLFQGIGSFIGGFVAGAKPTSQAAVTKKFARGGVVPGVGSGDTVPAMLEAGEYVIRKDSAQQIGYDRLHELNSGGRTRQRFASGGAAIHRYGYKPKPIFHGTSSGPLLGVELEVALPGRGGLREAGGVGLDRLNDSLGREEFAYLKGDASISPRGFEVVSHPATLDTHRERFPEALKALSGLGARSNSFAFNTGLHVHADRRALGGDYRLAKLAQLINSPRSRQYVEAVARRPESNFARFDPEQGLGRDSLFNPDRYRALNLKNRDTAELRIFGGTLDPDEFLTSLEFADAATVYSASGNTPLSDSGDPAPFFDFVSGRDGRYPKLAAFNKAFRARRRYAHGGTTRVRPNPFEDPLAFTGEYAADEAVKKVLFGDVPPSPRRPLGPRADDTRIQALSIIADRKRGKFATGGVVGGYSGLLRNLNVGDRDPLEFVEQVASAQSTSIGRRLNLGVKGAFPGGFRVFQRGSASDAMAALRVGVDDFDGFFDSESRSINLVEHPELTAESLAGTVTHELGHGIHLANTFGTFGGRPNFDYRFADESVRRVIDSHDKVIDRLPKTGNAKYDAYRSSPAEVFADAIHAFIYPETSRAAGQNVDDTRLAVLRSLPQFRKKLGPFRFATGGFVFRGIPSVGFGPKNIDEENLLHGAFDAAGANVAGPLSGVAQAFIRGLRFLPRSPGSSLINDAGGSVAEVSLGKHSSASFLTTDVESILRNIPLNRAGRLAYRNYPDDTYGELLPEDAAVRSLPSRGALAHAAENADPVGQLLRNYSGRFPHVLESLSRSNRAGVRGFTSGLLRRETGSGLNEDEKILLKEFVRTGSDTHALIAADSIQDRSEPHAVLLRELVKEGRAFGRFAKGGASSDTVPALLTPGEFVIRKEAASQIGLPNLERLNKHGVRGYAKGGEVKSFARGGRVSDGDDYIPSAAGIVPGPLDAALKKVFQSITEGLSRSGEAASKFVATLNSLSETLKTASSGGVVPVENVPPAVARLHARQAARAPVVAPVPVSPPLPPPAYPAEGELEKAYSEIHKVPEAYRDFEQPAHVPSATQPVPGARKVPSGFVELPPTPAAPTPRLTTEQLAAYRAAYRASLKESKDATVFEKEGRKEKEVPIDLFNRARLARLAATGAVSGAEEVFSSRQGRLDERLRGRSGPSEDRPAPLTADQRAYLDRERKKFEAKPDDKNNIFNVAFDEKQIKKLAQDSKLVNPRNDDLGLITGVVPDQLEKLARESTKEGFDPAQAPGLLREYIVAAVKAKLNRQRNEKTESLTVESGEYAGSQKEIARGDDPYEIAAARDSLARGQVSLPTRNAEGDVYAKDGRGQAAAVAKAVGVDTKGKSVEQIKREVEAKVVASARAAGVESIQPPPVLTPTPTLPPPTPPVPPVEVKPVVTPTPAESGAASPDPVTPPEPTTGGKPPRKPPKKRVVRSPRDDDGEPRRRKLSEEETYAKLQKKFLELRESGVSHEDAYRQTFFGERAGLQTSDKFAFQREDAARRAGSAHNRQVLSDTSNGLIVPGVFDPAHLDHAGTGIYGNKVFSQTPGVRDVFSRIEAAFPQYEGGTAGPLRKAKTGTVGDKGEPALVGGLDIALGLSESEQKAILNKTTSFGKVVKDRFVQMAALAKSFEQLDQILADANALLSAGYISKPKEVQVQKAVSQARQRVESARTAEITSGFYEDDSSRYQNTLRRIGGFGGGGDAIGLDGKLAVGISTPSDARGTRRLSAGIPDPSDYFPTPPKLAQAGAFERTLANRTADGGFAPFSSLAPAVINNAAQEGYFRRVTALGGEGKVSDETKGRIQSEELLRQESRSKKELISAEERLLRALGVAESEVRKLASQNVGEALAGLRKVTVDTQGKLLGTATTVRQASEQGISAPGANKPNRVGRFFEGASNFVGSAFSPQGSLQDSLLGRVSNRLGEFTGRTDPTGAARTGLLLSLPYAAQAFDSGAGSAIDRAKAGQENTFTALRATGGALTGGVVGSTLGGGLASAVGLGPAGAAIGATAGALFGLVQSIQDAKKELAQAKLGDALTKFADRLNSLNIALGNVSHLSPNLNPDAVSEARSGLAASEREQSEVSRLNAKQFLGLGFSGSSYLASQSRLNRENFGSSLPGAQQFLNTQLQQLARNNPTTKPSELVDRLKGQNGGLNQQLFDKIAEVRQLSPNSLTKEFEQTTVRAQKAAEVEKINLKARQGEEQNFSAFSRLILSLQDASDGLSNLRRQAETLGDLFENNISASRVSAGSERLDQLGRNGTGGLDALNIVGALGGSGGVRLREAGVAGDAVARELPGVLSATLAKGSVSGDDFTTEIGRGLRKQLGFGDDPNAKVPEQFQNALVSVSRALEKLQEERGISAVRDEAGVDVGQLSNKLLSALDPIREMLQRSSKQIEEEANRLAEGLATGYQRLQSVGQTVDQQGLQRVQGVRLEAQFRADREGRGTNFLDRLPLETLNSGLEARQRRLAGLGDLSNDPEAIGRALKGTQDDVQKATKRQQEIFSAPADKFATPKARTDAFEAATNEVTRLKLRAVELSTALKLLTDASERGAAAQEKLSRLKGEEDSRLGLAERYQNADPDERRRLDRGFELAQVAQQQGSLDNFTTDEKRNITDSLRAAGSATLTGFQGAPAAPDLLKKLLLGGESGKNFQLTPDQKGEKESLEGSILKAFQDADKAFSELAKNQKDLTGEFFRTLSQQHELFFNRLAINFKADEGRAASAKLGTVSADLDKKKKLSEQQELVKSIGFADGAQVKGARPALESYIEAVRKQAKFDEARGKSKEVALNLPSEALSNSAQGQERLKSELKLAFPNIGPDVLERAAGDLSKYSTPEESDDYKRKTFSGILFREFTKGITDTHPDIESSKNRLSGIKGFDRDKLYDSSLDDKKVGELRNALDAVSNGGKKFEDLNKEIQALEEEAKRLKKTIEDVNKVPPAAPGVLVPGSARGGPVGMAVGGNVFKPQGTDTVPAMLTPGEFVVNAASARANRKLLEKVNKSGARALSEGGTVYLAGGGTVIVPRPKKNLFEDPTARPAYDGGLFVGPNGPNRAAPAPDGLSDNERRLEEQRKFIANERAKESKFFAGGAGLPKPAPGAVTGPGGTDYFNLSPLERARMGQRAQERRAAEESLRPAPDRGGVEPGAFGGVFRQALTLSDSRAADAERQKELDQLRKEGRERDRKLREQKERDLRDRRNNALNTLTLDEQVNLAAGVAPGGRAAQEKAQFDASQAAASESALRVQNRIREQAKIDRELDRFGVGTPERAAVQKKAAALDRQKRKDLEEADRFGIDPELSPTERLRALEEKKVQMAGDDAGGKVVFGEEIANFNRLSELNFGTRRPGDDGQRNVAGRVLNVAQQDIQKRYAQDGSLNRFLQRQVASQSVRVPRFATGGPVPGHGSGDTVPALLTPGEFVLNKNAVSRAGVGQLQRFNSGGVVQPTGSSGGPGGTDSGLVRAFTEFGQSSQSLVQAVVQFNGNAQALADSINKMPRQLTGQFAHTVTVNHVGAEGLSRLSDEMRTIAVEEVKKSLRKVFKEQLPDANVNVDD